MYPYYKYGPDEIEGLKLPWTEELVSSEGAHYHCWIPMGLTVAQEKDLKAKFKSAARWKGDPVSFSWDYIPNGISHDNC